MRDLADLMDPALHLSISGRDYAVPCTAEQGLHLLHLFSTGLRLDDNSERAEIERMLGDAFLQMLADKVPWSKIVRAGRAAMFHFGLSEEAGQTIWEDGALSGNPLPPKLTRRRLRTLRGRANAATNAPAH